jgi:hypothetical protein
MLLSRLLLKVTLKTCVGCNITDATLRRPRPAERNERGKRPAFPSPDVALGDGDSALSLPSASVKGIIPINFRWH